MSMWYKIKESMPCISLFLMVISFLLLACRVEAFDSVFGQHIRANHVDLISIENVEKVVNSGAAVQYSRAEILFLLKVKSFGSKSK